MKTAREILQSSTEYLIAKEVEQPRKNVEWMLMEVLGISRMDLYMDLDRPLIENEIAKSREYLKRLAAHEPWPYIVGKVEFYGCSITVSKDVLIPRPETEQLVDKIVQKLQGRNLEGKVLWDLCTGSGCMGIALKKKFPELRVIVSDISTEALAVARKNSSEIEIRQGDLWSPFKGEQGHFIVSNPPYIRQGEKLGKSVVAYEPHGALFGGEDGLSFYRRLAGGLKEHLLEAFWCEIGWDQGPDVKQIFTDNGWAGTVEKDWSGKDRFFSLENE